MRSAACSTTARAFLFVTYFCFKSSIFVWSSAAGAIIPSAQQSVLAFVFDWSLTCF
ncbi:hypothetical protein BDA96_01G287100 [Sorghum bicolor]|uniref:Uncharacterized protein n=1 Tax=Sorghum bicolor TaxID=4558 RepID=A0A921S3D9_SORBI|nr:hypothetical protein BDA96_01G287100 [Sorghum bicolor]